MVYSSMMAKPTTHQTPAVSTSTEKVSDISTSVTSSYDKKEPIVEAKLVASPAVPLKDKELNLDLSIYGSSIKDIKLNDYGFTLPQNFIGLTTDFQPDQPTYNAVSNGVTFTYDNKDKGFEVKKSYTFTQDKFIVEMNLEFISHSDVVTYAKYNLNLATSDEAVIKKDEVSSRYYEVSISLVDKVLRKAFLANSLSIPAGNIKWVGIRDRYFCSIVKPMQDGGSLVLSKNNGLISYVLQIPAVEILPRKTVTHKYLIYLGPQKSEFISKMGSNCEQIVNYGFFDSVAYILLGILKFLFSICKNWGLALVLFSFLVFLILSPLSIHSFKSMKKMQQLQPLMEQLRTKYKDNPQRLNKEVMELYREKGVNPLGGCLPLFLQMPIFIALYSALMRFIDLRGAEFLWIKDLSQPDRLLVFKASLPIIGNELNILPLIMIVTMLIQQMMSSKSMQASGSANQQKIMGLFMAIFFGVIFYKMPSGLVLYWTINSIAMLIFQAVIFGEKKPATQEIV